ncbi:hypothetical protein DPMN_068827 [Dreissena polymorpha]|uniref:Uncharacterized protein n=1 Tax=Dreissena polymorpha TaxID=45954 RepID=A0A9D3YXX8_DREPO|nr:hypothetical protein DPMN_068827 [Dreissena polymorpha]
MVCDSANSMSLEPGFDLPSVVVVPCTKLNGIVSSINPSTVSVNQLKKPCRNSSIWSIA